MEQFGWSEVFSTDPGHFLGQSASLLARSVCADKLIVRGQKPAKLGCTLGRLDSEAFYSLTAKRIERDKETRIFVSDAM